MTKLLCKNFTPSHYTDVEMRECPEALYDFDFESSAPFVDKLPHFQIFVTSRHPPTDFFDFPGGGGRYIVSDRLRNELEKWGVPAEYLSADVVYRKEIYREARFWFLHLLDEVDCFDERQGRCKKRRCPNGMVRIEDIKKLVIDEKRAAGHHLYRVARCPPNVVCVSDELAASIAAAKFKGIRCQELHEYGLMY